MSFSFVLAALSSLLSSAETPKLKLSNFLSPNCSAVAGAGAKASAEATAATSEEAEAAASGAASGATASEMAAAERTDAEGAAAKATSEEAASSSEAKAGATKSEAEARRARTHRQAARRVMVVGVFLLSCFVFDGKEEEFKKKKSAVSKRRGERAQSMSSGAAATTKNRKRGPQRSINWPCLLATSSGTAERVRIVALGLVVKGSTGSSSRKERTVKRGKSRVDGRRALKEQDDSTSTAPRGFVASQAFRLSRQRADQETDSHAMHRERTRLDGGRERLRPTF